MGNALSRNAGSTIILKESQFFNNLFPSLVYEIKYNYNSIHFFHGKKRRKKHGVLAHWVSTSGPCMQLLVRDGSDRWQLLGLFYLIEYIYKIILKMTSKSILKSMIIVKCFRFDFSSDMKSFLF